MLLPTKNLSFLRVSFLLLLFSGSTVLFAQDGEEGTDTELWAGATLKVKVHKDLKVELEQQFRFDDGISAFDNAFSELSLRYNLNKYFKLKGSFRYSARNMDRNRKRYSLYLYYNWDKKKFPVSFQYRAGFQNDTEVWTDQQITFARNRIKLEYKNFKSITPFIAYEAFYRFNYRNEFRTSRYTGGLSWDIHPNLSTNIFYRIEQEINVKRPERQNIIGLMFIYNLKIYKKKKKN